MISVAFYMKYLKVISGYALVFFSSIACSLNGGTIYSELSNAIRNAQEALIVLDLSGCVQLASQKKTAKNPVFEPADSTYLRFRLSDAMMNGPEGAENIVLYTSKKLPYIPMSTYIKTGLFSEVSEVLTITSNNEVYYHLEVIHRSNGIKKVYKSSYGCFLGALTINTEIYDNVNSIQQPLSPGL